MARDTSHLIKAFESISNSDELVAFIDGLSMAEAKRLDQARDRGLCAREPEYLSRTASKGVAFVPHPD